MMFRHTWNVPADERCEALMERDVSFHAYLKGLASGQHTCGREITKCLRKKTSGSKFCWQHKRIFDESHRK